MMILSAFVDVGLGKGNEDKLNVTAFMMTTDQATQFAASNFSLPEIAKLGSVSQCTVNSENLEVCRQTVNDLDPDETYFAFAGD